MLLSDSLAKLSLAASTLPGLATKQLVFKPKTAKTAAVVPLVVFALADTPTPGKAVAAAAGVKDPRLAAEALVREVFGVAPAEFGIARVTDGSVATFVVDAAIQGSEVFTFASAAGNVNLTGEGLLEYLRLVGAEPIVYDFSTPVEAAPAAKPAKAPAPSAAIADAKLVGITVDKALDFPGWYSQVLTKGEYLDYYDVSGCYIMRPGLYAIWEHVQEWFNKEIRKIGVLNLYFPMFVSLRVLEREKDHIEGFAPEVAWVTKAGLLEMDEPIAIRPTLETVMYPYYAKWIRLHRDLPLKLNQWNLVVRWEFKHPQPFLRNREFLWQEGHTAHLTRNDAESEVMYILDLYEKVYTDLLAVPVIKGKKTEKEKFAGGLFTTTVEGYIPTTGRGIQGGTLHCLGQNFSKMFNIVVENPDRLENQPDKLHVWQNLWGLLTRLLGVMVMVHADNKGLVLPPRVAKDQVVVVPVGLNVKTRGQEEAVIGGAKDIELRLAVAGVRAFGDFREGYSPGWKFSDHELKGVPLRLEFGPNDLAKESVLAVARNDGKKEVVPLAQLEKRIPEILEEIQAAMYAKAKASYDEHRVSVTSWSDFITQLNNKNVVVAPWCGVMECEEDIKESSARTDDGEEEDEKAPLMGAKSLCIPFEQADLPKDQGCVKCDRPAIQWCMFGRSY